MKALAILGGIVGMGVLLIFTSVLNGYALSVLWGWFVVPTFSLPALGVVPAIGIAMVVSYITHQPHDCNNEDKSVGEKLASSVAFSIMKPLFALAFGWVVHLFM